MDENDKIEHLEKFIKTLNSDGVVASTVKDGTLIAFSEAKLKELLKEVQACKTEPKQVIIFIKRPEAQDKFIQ